VSLVLKKLSDFCKTSSGGTPSRSTPEFFENGNIPWIKSGELKNRYLTEVEEKITQLAVNSSSAKIVPKGALLIAMYGATVGEVSQLLFDATTNQAVCSIIPDDSLCDVNYLYRYLQAQKDNLLNLRVGGGQPNISQGIIKDLIVPLPPLEEQRRIASILDKADDIRQKRQQAIAKLDELLQATFIDMFGDPVSNPKSWEFKLLKEFGTFKNGLNYGKGESGVTRKYIGVGNFKNFSKLDDIDSLGSIELNQDPSQDYFLKDGDLLFVRSNGNKELVGRCIAVYPKSELVTYSGFCIRYRIEKQGLTPEFISHLFRSESFRSSILKAGQGANIQNINQQSLGELKIPVPSEDLLAKWSKILNQVERQKTLYSAELEHSLFSSLQQKAFNGTL